MRRSDSARWREGVSAVIAVAAPNMKGPTLLRGRSKIVPKPIQAAAGS
jgi:hypothetical protein